MSKLIKIILITTLILVSIINYTNIYAFGDIKAQGDNFISKGNKGELITEVDVINQFIDIGRILVQVATIVLVVVGLILGIKYMTSGADEKANIKQKLIWYVISIVLVYGAVGIYTVTKNILENRIF